MARKTWSLKAIVLRRFPLRESDLIVHLLSEQQGKVSALVRGGLKSKKRFPGGLDLFDCGVFELSDGKGQMPSIDSLSQRKDWPGIRTNLLALQAAMLWIEAVDSFAQEEDASAGELFPKLIKSLQALEKASNDDLTVQSISNYLLSSILHQGGYCPWEQRGRETWKEWWEAMKNGGNPIIPNDQSLPASGLQILANDIQEINGRELKSLTVLLKHRQSRDQR